ncbi:MAG: TRAP transporter small permease [Deltaproteobacteria bacterium]|nr:TRAP transporter small permease [Deltaproteobacteria bacterium]
MTPSPLCKNRLPRMMAAADALAGALNRVAGAILFFMMLLTLIDVLLRKFWSQGILGGLELTEFMLAGMVFCALAQAEVEDRHVRVDLIAGRLHALGGKYLTAFIQLLSTVMMGAISVSAFVYALSIRTAGEVSLDLGIPRYPLILVATLGCALLGFVMLVRSWMKFSEKRGP